MMTEMQTKIAGLLRDGYGAEDIAIKLETKVSGVRYVIQEWRWRGHLRSILGTTIQMNRRALKTMGVIDIKDPEAA